MKDACCFDCRFFSPGEHGCPSWETENSLPKQWDESFEGLCRFNTPLLGDLIKDKDGDEFRFFGQWPKMMACDWCRKFKSRKTRKSQLLVMCVKAVYVNLKKRLSRLFYRA